MNKFIQQAINNPKTTINGALSFVAVTSAVLAPYVTTPKAVAGLAIAAALARAYMGAMQHDAGTQLALVPGSSEPQLVPSHEVPDQKGAVVVPAKDK